MINHQFWVSSLMKWINSKNQNQHLKNLQSSKTSFWSLRKKIQETEQYDPIEFRLFQLI